MSISLGSVTLEDPVILAPMSGVTDLPFRRLVKRAGAGLVVSEMIASEAMIRATKRSMKMTSNCAEEFPMAVQLAGCEPEVMAEAARLNADRGAAIIDINFGCPVKKVVNKQAGSAIMRDEALAGCILEAVVRAVSLPVTMKMRLGWDDANRNAPSLARIAEQAGIRMITVHGRTRCQLYGGSADWDAVAAVRAATSLPLVVNGDIADGPSAVEALRRSGADGVMIGRAACGRPWLLRQVIDYLRRGKSAPEPTPTERGHLVLEHYDAMLSHYGEASGVRMARKHLSWYAQGLRGANDFRVAVNREPDPAKVRQAIIQLFLQEAEALAA
ncbi:tRNA dihydrouridine synthase DusB [Aquibaculum arenosum]|uniref:tRNA-dihydrouridine synthase n=1 Tax=Aquibaculum arenosum TaxID=3032591 RepID=A0ABT5YMY5_9PROT|nr:tRNA dihydrouridine synthase DusB [Fodinicurvata sp. CAU 1616]MDF2096176.1 tRNA dihydrouridine synthase DusB [Fodinicurvata sp. CAU 1616]